MNENQSNESRPIVRSVFVLLRHWKFLAAALIVPAVAALVYAFTLPNWYKSRASFLPPTGQSGLLEQVAGGLSSTLKSFGVTGLGETEGYSYIAILESRRMGETIIREFDLMKVYDIDDGSMEKALKALSGNSEFSYEEEGRVVISVWDTDPKRAAEMAAAYFTHLNEISTELNSLEARNNRAFMELQYTGTRDSLRRLEERFAAFQKRTKIFSLEEQTKATISAAGDLYAQLKFQQVKLEMLEKNLGPDDAEVRAQRALVAALAKQVPGLGDNELTGLLGEEGSDLSAEGLEYMRMYRDIEILSKLQAILLPMYQQSVIEEQKQMHVLVPLDKPSTPERKDRPKRSIYALVAGFSALALAMAFVLLRERFHFYRAQYPDEWATVRRSMGFKRGAE